MRLCARRVRCSLPAPGGKRRRAGRAALPEAMIGAVNYSEVVAKLCEAGVDEATSTA